MQCYVIIKCKFFFKWPNLKMKTVNTVFPRNLAAAGFYFKATFGAATIRGWLDFEGGVYRDRHAREYTASIISLFVYT